MSDKQSSRVQAVFNGDKRRIEITLSVLNWESEGVFFQYSPALDLTGYGSSEDEADKSFQTVLNEFVLYTENKKTIYNELERLGWTVNKKKKRVSPPTREQILEDNETYRDLQNMPNVKMQNTNIGLALA